MTNSILDGHWELCEMINASISRWQLKARRVIHDPGGQRYLPGRLQADAFSIQRDHQRDEPILKKQRKLEKISIDLVS
ncbi:hypothetical protein Trydic_g11944 [Trypoxylus dichotomus]